MEGGDLCPHYVTHFWQIITEEARMSVKNDREEKQILEEDQEKDMTLGRKKLFHDLEAYFSTRLNRSHEKKLQSRTHTPWP
jgi:hypothetical protein